MFSSSVRLRLPKAKAEIKRRRPCRLFPAPDRIPGNSFESSDGELVQDFDAENHDLIKGGATMLESMVRYQIRAERLLPANPTDIGDLPRTVV